MKLGVGVLYRTINKDKVCFNHYQTKWIKNWSQRNY